ncbi:MAG: hypothetical protein GX782_08200 [Gammaproteobacteria bacterium]|nr:hypothetical protein [Gammaproteobacteria bacterium]
MGLFCSLVDNHSYAKTPQVRLTAMDAQMQFLQEQIPATPTPPQECQVQ